MKLSPLSTTALLLAAINVTAMSILPSGSSMDIFNELPKIVDWNDHTDMLYELGSLNRKRDTAPTIEYILNAVNRSGLIFDVLDQIAYEPERIELVANLTGKLLGNNTLSSLGYILKDTSLNYSLIYESVQDSGVVESLLDGILLDADYRPNLVKLVTRVLNGSKNIVLYVVKDIFKKSKREDSVKKSTIEVLVGNTLAAILSSDLVSHVADEALVALNNTQFLTYTVKKFIANEGYQNMTAQIGIDLIRNGDLKLDSRVLNMTNIVDSALSRPDVILKLVSMALSGNLNTGDFGKYTGAIKEILDDTEDTGVFALLNDYVFSQTHSVSTPLIPTGNIVVPKTTKTSKRLISGTKATSTKSSSTTKASLSSQSTDSSEASMNSANEVASILSLLGASTYKSSRATSASSSTPGFNLSNFLASFSETTSSSSTTDLGNLESLLALLARSSGPEEADVSLSSVVKSTNERSTSKSGSTSLIATKLLIYAQIAFVGIVLFL